MMERSIWNAGDGHAIIATLEGHGGSWSPPFQPGRNAVVTASARQDRAASGTRRADARSQQGHDGPVVLRRLQPRRGRGLDGLRRWIRARSGTPPTGREIASLRGHDGNGLFRRFQHRRHAGRTASDDAGRAIWDAAVGRPTPTLPVMTAIVSSAASARSRARRHGVARQDARIWDAASGGRELAAHQGRYVRRLQP